MQGNIQHPKDAICEYIASKLPGRIVLWVITLVFDNAAKYLNKAEAELRYEDVWFAWKNKMEGKDLQSDN